MVRGVTALVLLLAASGAMAAQGEADQESAACDQGSGATAVLLTVDGFKSREGKLRIELWPGNDKDFLRDHRQLLAEGKVYKRITVDVPKSGPAQVCVKLPGPGVYALGAFHSPAGVPKFNFRTDGATFTRNPRMGLSKPKASEVAMEFGQGLNRSAVTLNYLRGFGFRPIPKDELRSAEIR